MELCRDRRYGVLLDELLIQDLRASYGRIDRMNTWIMICTYYVLSSRTAIDGSIKKALDQNGPSTRPKWLEKKSSRALISGPLLVSKTVQSVKKVVHGPKSGPDFSFDTVFDTVFDTETIWFDGLTMQFDAV